MSILTTLNIDKSVVTLIAAGIAAVVSLLTLILTIIFNKKGEIRKARRQSLEKFIFKISDSIHQLIAISNILLKNKSDVSRANWNKKAEDAKKTFKELRPKVRYALWGIDKPLRSLTRLPDFAQYTIESKETCEKVVKRGSKLGNSIDNCIRKCYLNGRSPRLIEIWYLKYLAIRFEKVRNNYKQKKNVA